MALLRRLPLAAVLVLATASAAAAAPAARTFAPYEAHRVGSWPSSVAVGDFTGDGRADVVMSTTFYFDPDNDYKVFLFAQRPDGSLGPPDRLATNGTSNQSEFGLAAGDLNGDGKADVALAHDRGLDVFLQADGTLSPARHLPLVGFARQVEIADVNQDGRNNMVVAKKDGVVLVRGSRASGLFAPPVPIVQGGQVEIEVGDVTGDRRPDVVGFTGATVHVFPQAALGLFGPARSYQASVGYWLAGGGLEVADLNGDGRKDVALSIGGNRPGARMNVFLQTATGTLAPPAVYDSYDIPEPVEAADLDDDRRTDLATLHGGWVRAGVYTQQGDGTFAAEALYPIPYASHYSVKGLALGDVSGDSRPDMVLADYNHGLVVLRQSG